MIDNDGDGVEEVTYQFRFQTKVGSGATFLYNIGQVSYNSSTKSFTNLNVQQTYSVTKVLWQPGGASTPSSNITLGTGSAGRRRLTSDPAPRPTTTRRYSQTPSTPSRPGETVFAGPTCRRLLRGPRLDLRPRHSEAVRERPPHTDAADHHRRQRNGRVQRPLDSDSGPHHRTDEHTASSPRG